MLLTALLLQAAAPSPAPKTLPDIDGDIRCFVTTAAMAGGQAGASLQDAAKTATLYWMGRIDAVLTDAEIRRRLIAALAQMTPADLQADAKRCGDEMAVRGDAMRAIGDTIHAMAAKSDTR